MYIYKQILIQVLDKTIRWYMTLDRRKAKGVGSEVRTLSELDILKIAISIEEDGARFYSKLHEKSQDDEQKRQVFRTIMNEEKNHAIIFRDLYQKVMDKNQQLDNGFFHGHVPGIVQSLVDYFVLPKEDVFSRKDLGFKDIIDEAVVQEYRSIEFYYRLAQNARDDEVKKLLFSIIREEEKHVIKLKEMVYFKNTRITVEEHIYFVENVLNGMEDWVRVIDLEDNIIYANNAMKEDLGYYLIGRKCFEVIGRQEPCADCISQMAVNNFQATHKEETINDRVYSVMSSPLRDLNGEVTAVIEVLRDVTEAKKMEDKLKKQNERLHHDLQIARKMQYNSLPVGIKNDSVVFSYLYQPSEMIGGDFFDVFDIDEDHVGLYIADVSGHGIPASMLTMYLRQSIDKDLLSPAEVLNNAFKNYNETAFDEEMYITMFFGIIDLKNMTITYANAGQHTLPILYNQNREKMIVLDARGIPISRWMDECVYEEYIQKIEPEDRLMLYTDGVAELCNSMGERYGEDRLYQFILNNKEKSIDEVKKCLFSELLTFKNEGSLEEKDITDDITAVFLEIL